MIAPTLVPVIPRASTYHPYESPWWRLNRYAIRTVRRTWAGHRIGLGRDPLSRYYTYEDARRAREALIAAGEYARPELTVTLERTTTERIVLPHLWQDGLTQDLMPEALAVTLQRSGTAEGRVWWTVFTRAETARSSGTCSREAVMYCLVAGTRRVVEPGRHHRDPRWGEAARRYARLYAPWSGLR